ncbi:hypothetical protein [Nocardioides sp. BYT-33-1]|uniref:hypothetical protein n=1 Tax=Nocardioides sp. BYT-33-1 TaxID=3416952 RepID=UPI003F533200
MTDVTDVRGRPPLASPTVLRVRAAGEEALLLRIASLVAHYDVRRFTLDARGDGSTDVRMELGGTPADPAAGLLERRLGRIVGVTEVVRTG